MKVRVIDSIMGSGKTQFIIQQMNEVNDKRYIYITPFLSEVERVKSNVKNKRFYEPIQRGKGKLSSFVNLIKQGKDIVSTHALFSTANEEVITLLKLNNYSLVLDEVMDVIDIVGIEKDDLDILINGKMIIVNEEGNVIWNKEEYNGKKFKDIKVMAQHNRLIMGNNSLMLWMFPVDVFKCFEEVLILTYMFNGQIMKYYYDLYNIKYEYNSVKLIGDKFELIEYEDGKKTILDLINIENDRKLNVIGREKFNLSYSWYNIAKDSYLEVMKRNLNNFFKNKYDAKSKDILWTTFLGSDDRIRKALHSKGFQSRKCFAPMNSRATNEYSDRTIVAYTVNRFINPYLKNFFVKKGIEVDENVYALSEMLQFIFRSGVRNGKKIQLYIPSSRMRNLLLNFISK